MPGEKVLIPRKLILGRSGRPGALRLDHQRVEILPFILTYRAEFQRGTDNVGFHDESHETERATKAIEAARGDGPLCCGCATSGKESTSHRDKFQVLHRCPPRSLAGRAGRFPSPFYYSEIVV